MQFSPGCKRQYHVTNGRITYENLHSQQPHQFRPVMAPTQADLAGLQDTVIIAAAICISLLTAIAMALMRR